MTTHFSIWDHLVDLKKMFLRILLSWSIGIGATIAFREKVMWFYTNPLKGTNGGEDTILHFMKVSEAMFFNMKIHMFSGFVVVFPLIIFFVWKFVAPALRSNERKSSIWYIIATIFLSFFAIIYGYYYMMPVALRFLLGIGINLSGFTVSVTASNYFSFFTGLFGVLILIFQLPVLVYTIARFRVVKIELLKKHRKEIYFGLMAIVFAVAPGDVMISGMLLVPIIVFYEVALSFASFGLKREDKRKRKKGLGGSVDSSSKDLVDVKINKDVQNNVTEDCDNTSSSSHSSVGVSNTTTTDNNNKFHL